MPLLYESYAKSSEAVVSGQKKPTRMFIYLWDESGRGERQEGKTLYVGTRILIRTGLFTVPWNTSLDGKRHIIYHKLDDGSWEKLADVAVARTDSQNCNFIELLYTLTKAGTHSFYSEFLGDSEYEGCQKAAKTFARPS